VQSVQWHQPQFAFASSRIRAMPKIIRTNETT
jgi:hypothetical protein